MKRVTLPAYVQSGICRYPSGTAAAAAAIDHLVRSHNVTVIRQAGLSSSPSNVFAEIDFGASCRCSVAQVNNAV